MQIDWQYLQDNWDWAGHMLEAAILAVAVTFLFRLVLDWKTSAIVGFSFANGHFHGREKRDYEVSLHMAPPHIDGYRMWDWSWDQMTDFWPTSAMCAIIVFVIAWRTGLSRFQRKP